MPVDERKFFKYRQFLKDGFEQRNISIQSLKTIARSGLKLLQQGDPVAEKLLKLGLNNPVDEVETYVSPDEKALFQLILTTVENAELEI